MSNHTLRTDLDALDALGFSTAPVVTYFVARCGESEHSDVYLWRVENGNIGECQPILCQRGTDENVWQAAVDALDSGLPSGVTY
jgi:hypothetical protein